MRHHFFNGMFWLAAFWHGFAFQMEPSQAGITVLAYDRSGNQVSLQAGSSEDPVIVLQPSSLTTAPGGSAGFSIAVASGNPVTFQWKFEGVDIPGATGDTLYLPEVSAANAGAYTVVVTNAEGAVTSEPAYLWMNDDFANRVPLAGTPASTTGGNENATSEAGEPVPEDGSPNSVWWTWTAPVSGRVTISTNGSDFDTVLAVFTGESVDALVPVASNDDSGGSSKISLVDFEAEAGVAYQIAVWGYTGAAGSIALSVSLQENPQAPSNDGFANREPLEGISDSAAGSNQNATAEYGEPLNTYDVPKSVWWTWTAPGPGLLTISTEGSAIDAVFAVYTGNAVDVLSRVPALETSGSPFSLGKFLVEEGTTYHIAVDTADGFTGAIALSVNALIVANDDFAGRETLAGTSVSIVGNNEHATSEAGEPANGFNWQKSVWWTWTAPGPGLVTISTAGSEFDTVLTVYAGEALDGLNLVASNDDSGGTSQSSVQFAVEGGETYQIGVAGWNGAAGAIALSLEVESTPDNDDFASAFPLLGSTVETPGTNLAATSENDEPPSMDGAKSVWWVWTAPADGYLSVSTAGSDFDTILAVFRGTGLADLIELDFNDDELGAETFQSRLNVPVDGGETYYLAVGGFFGASGTVALALSFAALPDPPIILMHPETDPAQTNGEAGFSAVVASGVPVAYQWKRNGEDIPGATADSLVITGVTSADEGVYTVVVTNAAGSVTSSPASLFIDDSGNGLPDAWEQEHFGNLDQPANGDYDDDGVLNIHEFLNGSDPAVLTENVPVSTPQMMLWTALLLLIVGAWNLRSGWHKAGGQK